MRERIFKKVFSDQVISAAQDLFQIEMVSRSVEIRRCIIAQSSDHGDSNAQGLTIKVIRVTNTVTEAGDAIVKVSDPNGPAATARTNVNQGTQLITGAAEIWAEPWSILTPWLYIPDEEERDGIAATEATVITIPAPVGSITVSGILVWAESVG